MLLKMDNVVAALILILVLSFMGTLPPAASTSSPVAKPGCQSRCGNVTIPYPFGIGSADCFYSEWYQIICKDERPYIHINQDGVEPNEVVNIGIPSDGMIRIRSSTSNMRLCEDTSQLLGNPYIHDGCQVGGTSLLISILAATTYLLYKIIRRRIQRKKKQKMFKQNGGLLLQNYLSSNKNIMENVRLFTGKNMNTATDQFNENRVLGRGGQGTVYKGMLQDGKIVAIKKSKLLGDANQVEGFINEIIILSQIDQKNVVKLYGCCLEMDVPLLVYEFIPNGTLYNLIHSENTIFPLSWEVRLRISLEVAEALAYLHSSTSIPVYHRDVKSSNILLDEKYRVKVADFGTSRNINIDQTHITTLVKGTFGYLDPEYFQSSQFTEKSDVYSFGVVLVELLTGLKPICFSEEEQSHLNLAGRFLLAMEENCVDEILDPQVKETCNEEELKVVIKLSQRCLNVNGRNRPSMKEIVMELQGIKKSIPSSVLANSYENDGIAEKEIKLLSISTSIHLTTSSLDASPLISSSF